MAHAVVFTHSGPWATPPPMAIFSALVRRGEQLTIYAEAGCREAIEAAGAAYRSYGDIAPGLTRPERFEQLAPRLLAAMEARPPDYLVLDAQAGWGQFLAGVLHLPSVSYCTIGWHAGEMPELIESNDQCRCDLNLVLTPRGLQHRGDLFDASFRFVGRCVEEAAEAGEFPWRESSLDPLIHISAAGIVQRRAEFLRGCMGAFGDLPFEVMVARDELAGPAPANFRLVRPAPLRVWLERATLTINGAEPDVAQQAAGAGVPQLMFPGSFEADLIALQVERLGAGLRLTGEDLEGSRLREIAGRVMADPSYCRAAEALRQAVRQCGGTAEACDAILAWTSARGSR